MASGIMTSAGPRRFGLGLGGGWRRWSVDVRITVRVRREPDLQNFV